MHYSMTIEKLLEAANSSTEGDTSVNLAKRTFLDQSDCDAFFGETCSKLRDLAEWNKNSSATECARFDDSGNMLEPAPLSVGNFIRMSLTGSGKYDWVQVISIVEEENEFIVTVKPTFDPTEQPPDRENISHFFGPEATNNFCVQRVDKAVTFYVIGLNERQNSKFTDSLIESARNAAVANVGYYSGLQKAVWKQFASNFLKTDEEKEA